MARPQYPVSALRILTTYLNAESSEHLRRTLARLDRAEQIALREGIGKAAIRRVFGRVLVPGIPEKHASDAASLLRIPEGETNQTPALVKKALGNWYREEPSREGAPGGLGQSFGFPLPPLKFRTAGFPQYGFKWTVNGDLRRCPKA